MLRSVRVVLSLAMAMSGGLSVTAFAPLAIRALRSTARCATTTSSATDFLQDLLPSLASSGSNAGQRLLEASSESWRVAIFNAVGAKLSVEPGLVASALYDAMSRADNQFAILLGNAEPFVANFPSDVVDYQQDDNGTAWVECRLRHATTDELLVTMGISVVQSDDGQWFIASLDWQDFRERFYPGLSGREWLRAF